MSKAFGLTLGYTDLPSASQSKQAKAVGRCSGQEECPAHLEQDAAGVYSRIHGSACLSTDYWQDISSR